MERYNVDVAILGGGPAGLTSAIYCARYNLKTLIINKGQWGGKLNIIHDLANYPGFEAHDGKVLATTMVEQVRNLGVTMLSSEIDDIRIDDQIILSNDDLTITATDLIIACGSKPFVSKIKNANRLIGHGVSYCATCDAMFFKGKTVAVFGDSKLAVKEALHLAHIVDQVVFVTPLDRQDPLVQPLHDMDNIIWYDHATISCVNGDDHVESIEINNQDGSTTVQVSALFPYEQADGSLQFLKVFGIQDPSGFITVNHKMETIIPHVYAIGDIVVKPLRQVVTAASDGAICALSIFESKHQGKSK